ncbi:MAG: winged helix-turn-helix transcriptional regulator [Infirmifilum sp.]
MLDENDLKVLEVLIRSPRATISEIARETGLSRPTVRSRLEKLLKSQLIKGIRLELDDEILGGKTFLVSVYSENPEEAFQEILSLPGVDDVFMVQGRPNILAFFHVYDLDSLTCIMDQVKKIDNHAEVKLVHRWKSVNNIVERIVASGKGDLHCETCGTRIKGNPYVYVYRNKKYFFCCPVCRQEFIEKIRRNEHKTQA